MKSIIQHLRFPFSFLLLPVFLFALSESVEIDHIRVTILFFVLHVLVYPSSNGYNSFEDRDEESIGLIASPMKVNKNLHWVCIFMDALAILFSLFISVKTAMCIAIYITASRMYSWRYTRLKRFPFIGFFVVFFFQGLWVYLLTRQAVDMHGSVFKPWDYLLGITSSCFIGAMYVLSQIYQYHQDRADGVTTLSYKLGRKGSFYFAFVLFLLASILLLKYYWTHNKTTFIFAYLISQQVVSYYFLRWFLKVRKDKNEANYKNCMQMTLISSISMNLFFAGCLILKYFG